MAGKKDGLCTGEKWLVWLTIGFVTLVGGTGWWWYESEVMPTYTPPPVKLPAVNANDDFRRAGLLCKTRIGAGTKRSFSEYDFRKVITPTGEYQLPKPVVRPPSPSGYPTPPPKPRVYPTLAEIETLVAVNEPAFQAMCRGLGKPHCRPDDEQLQPTNEYYIKNLAKFRGYAQRRHGQWPQAVTTYLDGIEYGITKCQGVGLTGIYWEEGSQREVCGAIWSAIPHLSAAQARAAAGRLAALRVRQVSLQAAMESEQSRCLGAVHARLRDPEWRGYNSTDRLAHFSYHRRHIFADYRRYMRECIAYAGRPYALRGQGPTVPAYESEFVYNMEYYICNHSNYLAQQAMLHLGFCLRAYRLEHGAYPATLQELAPEYLTSIPDDPFALKRPFCYRRTGSGYLLYSIGPDGKDDGGTPYGKGKGAIDPSSIGDIVAGVNFQ